MGDAGEDDLIPAQILAITCEKLLPVAFGVLAIQPFYELVGSFHDAVGLRDRHGFAVVLTGRGFQSDVRKEQVIDGWGSGVQLAEPTVGIVDLNGMKSIAGNMLE